MAVPQYKDEVLVTLNSVDPPSTFSCPRRQILLTKENPCMDIGRTSKRNTSLEASKNNAWFDSAVMSRDHAQLRLDADKQKVYIKDIGSLHGTFHNGERLSRQSPSELNNGDLLKFGIPIERGADKYPPCVMETRMEFGSTSPQDRPKVFRVPDESDAEDSCNDDVDDSVRDSAKIARKIITPTRTAPYELHLQSPRIDLTLCDQYPMSDLRNHQASSNNAHSLTHIMQPAQDTTCVDLTYLSEDDTDRLHQSSRMLDDLLSLGGDRSPELAQSSSSHVAETHATFGDTSLYSSDTSLSPGPIFCPQDDQISICDDSESERDDDSEAEDMIDLDEESEDSDRSDRSESSEEEMETYLSEDDFEEHDDFEDEDMDDSADATREAFSNFLDATTTIPPPPPFAETQALANHSRPLIPMGTETELEIPLASDVTFTRLPSIRDVDNQLPSLASKHWASLPKYRLPSIHEATSKVINSQLSQTARSLGEKTGKHEYFEAREENRIRIIDCQAQNVRIPATSDLEEHRKVTSAPTNKPTRSALVDTDPQDASMGNCNIGAGSHSTPPMFTPATKAVSGEKPNSVPSKSCEPPTQARPSAFDAGSAYEFEQMCLEAQKYQETLNKAVETPQVSQVSENDSEGQAPTIENKSTPEEALADLIQASKSLKRKAAEISQLTQEEEAAETSSSLQPQVSLTTIPRHRRKSDVSKVTTQELSARRPSKRLRRVAEAFGYVALGGVAVMSALIATAPTL